MLPKAYQFLLVSVGFFPSFPFPFPFLCYLDYYFSVIHHKISFSVEDGTAIHTSPQTVGKKLTQKFPEMIPSSELARELCFLLR